MSKELLEATYEMVGAYDVIVMAGKIDTMQSVLVGMGYTQEKIDSVINFIHNNLTQEELNVGVERQAYVAYINAVEKIEKLMQMAQGYQEMGELNLTIAQEDHHLEEEGAKLHEMDSKEGETTA
jgi:hypothetical protein